MTKEELRKEFNEAFFFNSNELFDWFYKKLEEKEAKLKAADDVIAIWEGYIEEEETGSFYINMKKTIEKYKSL